ncbi:ABC-type multidrug transport system ATPase component-like protein [Halorubrum lacusprofundi ATCC 49239]|jgi:ABC-2 type transport system ATP-binding protein|uniref:ABC-type multidrug transport system ATPase component-like protein n=1 Tax=Halorubrum lacusprofundi (strain ATCC 49239 / DSM 5036 / JCM 8891 / ACAM 34) TaxID=416348 RepID=B9LUU7_HALLT|nr:ABC-type multidrug transport system ATPase component-like protein [Halorubrum lacusprofundi ATCC 49239]
MPAIECRSLTKYYGDVRGIEDVSFAVEDGEVFGFFGPNGAGKTIAIRTLLGFLSPTSGGATLIGHDAHLTGGRRPTGRARRLVRAVHV